MGSKNNKGNTGSGSFRDSGEFKESKQQGTEESRQAQRDIGRKAGQELKEAIARGTTNTCLLYTSPSPRDGLLSRMPSSA